jgi:hypothetical protein
VQLLRHPRCAALERVPTKPGSVRATCAPGGGLGTWPLSIDCSSATAFRGGGGGTAPVPSVYGTCASMDCLGRCNGTCPPVACDHAIATASPCSLWPTSSRAPTAGPSTEIPTTPIATYGVIPTIRFPTQLCDLVGGGSRFGCVINETVGTSTVDAVVVRSYVECDLDVTSAFDYRRAPGCTCTATLTPSGSNRPKTCDCAVCRIGYGDQSTAVNGSNTTAVDDDNASAVPADPYIYGPCVSRDCLGRCNGACPPLACQQGPASWDACRLCETQAPSVEHIRTASPAVGPIARRCAIMEGGSRFWCSVTQRLGDGASYAEVTAHVECDLDTASSGFRYRNATGRTCSANLTSLHLNDTRQQSKICPCSVCPAGFGSASLSSNCSGRAAMDEGITHANASLPPPSLPDPYVYGSCASTDCLGRCNGTCRLPLACRQGPAISEACNLCPTPSGRLSNVAGGARHQRRRGGDRRLERMNIRLL